jgi:hypothetical protein
MTSRVTEIIVDSKHPMTLASWWAETLGYHLVQEGAEGWVAIAPWRISAEAPSEDEYRHRPQLPRIVFVPVGEAKAAKNRLHLDIWPVDRTQEQEVEALIARGARKVDIGQRDVSWEVLADPEGNEFCVLE